MECIKNSLLVWRERERQRQFPGFDHCIEYQMNLIYGHWMFFQHRMTLKRKATREEWPLSSLALSFLLILCYKTLIRVHDVFGCWTDRSFGFYSIGLIATKNFSSKKTNCWTTTSHLWQASVFDWFLQTNFVDRWGLVHMRYVWRWTYVHMSKERLSGYVDQ